MKMITADLVMTFGPCKEDWPESRVRKYLPKPITVIDLLKLQAVLPEYRLWVALRTKVINENLLRRFVCDCAERSLKRRQESGLIVDQRSWNAVTVSRMYADRKANIIELGDAHDAAWWAAQEIESEKISPLSWAAWSAAWASQENMDSAAWASAEAAACSEDGVIAEQMWQCQHLIKMIEKQEQ